MAISHDLPNTLHYQSFTFDKRRTQKPCLIFVSLYLPDYQQGWTSCVSIRHMYFCPCKLPVSIYLRCYSRGSAFGVFLWLLCRDSLATMEINHLSTFMLQIFLPRLSLVFLDLKVNTCCSLRLITFLRLGDQHWSKGCGDKEERGSFWPYSVLFPLALRTFCNISTSHPFISLFLSPIGNSHRTT